MKEILLLTADLHFTENKKDSYRWQIFPYLIEQVKKYNVDRLIILGDLTEKKNNHDASLVNKIVEGIDSLAEVCAVDILMGNHDGTDLDNPYFGFLRKMQNVRFITRILQDEETYLFLPYTKNSDYDWRDVSFDRISYIFMHQCLKGVQFANRHISEHGVQLNLGKTRVFAGDIHLPQDIGSKFTYVGSPYSIDFGDHFNGRVILIKDDREISLYPGFLKKWSIEIKDVGELKHFKFGEADDQVKIKFLLHPSDFYKINDLRKEIKEICIKKKVDLCSLEMKPLKVVKRERLILQEVGKERKSLSPVDILKQFVDKEKLGDVYLDIGKELLV